MRGIAERYQQGLDGFARRHVHGLLAKIDRGIDRMDGGMHQELGRIDAAVADDAEQVRLTVHYVSVLAK